MHDSLLKSDDIDYNLYPALLQVFAIIVIGYLAASFELLSKSQVLGLNKFVSTFALPSLIFKSIVVLDFSVVNWLFLSSIFLAKAVLFFTTMLVTVIAQRPVNIGLAGIFAIYVSQSNDFALGYPIVDAIYSKTHPEYIHYIYLIAPISLCILNPIAFFMMELNEIIAKKEEPMSRNRLLNGDNDNLLDNLESVSTNMSINSNDENNNAKRNHANGNESLDSILPVGDQSNPSSYQRAGKRRDENDDKDNDEEDNESDHSKSTSTQNSTYGEQKVKYTTVGLMKKTFKSTISNPIVFMTIIGLVANFVLNKKLPFYIEPILTTLANSFSALALFYLGYTMVGKIKNLNFSSVIVILILVFAKSILFPLLTREVVFHLVGYNLGDKNETESLSTFGFLYGTFPAAPSIFFYLTRFKSISDDLISSALVFGTLVSAPLMMISGKMISIKSFNSSNDFNFEDIECKTAFGFSILNWFCCLWVLYIFLASGRLFAKSHRFTFLLIVAQMANSLVHIIWSTATTNVNNLNSVYGYLHVIVGLFFAFMTRCTVLSIMLNVISLIQRSTPLKSKTFLTKLLKSKFIYYFIAFGLPFLTTFLCMVVGGVPEKQKMMITVGKRQIIIANTLLSLIIAAIAYFMIIFGRLQSKQKLGFFSSIYGANSHTSQSKVKKTNNFSFDAHKFLADEEADSFQNDAEKFTTFNNDESAQRLIQSKHISLDYKKERNLERFNEQYQISKQVSLVVILGFNSLICLFFQMWTLFDEAKSGIFYELQLLDVTLLYGQGFFTFLTFGFDNIIFEPVIFRIKEWLRLVEPFKLPRLEEVPGETIELCRKFDEHFKQSCFEEIVQDYKFHYKVYHDSFKGSDLVNWLVDRKLSKNRTKAIEYGRKLLNGRIIAHVSNKRHFHDGFHLYKFNSEF